MPQVKVIPPMLEQAADKLRVAVYARVSSDSDDQLNSFATQVDYYTACIQSKEEWVFAGLYADEAVSGTSTDKRDDFKRLLADCRAGKIDRILVKSVSRFARNTLDCIQTVRELKQLGITVEFEKENIDTGAMGSEMLLSILGAAAQEESLSISSNLKWSYRRRMKSGDFLTYSAPLGFFLKNHALVPDPQEILIVEYIFSSYLAGKSMAEIAEDLNEQETQAVGPYHRKWLRTSIQYILTNEKYIGDTLVQKRYTTASLPYQRKVNQGQFSKFYIQNSHPAIISKDTFEAVQALWKQRNALHAPKGKIQKFPLTRKMQCGLCGAMFHRHWVNSQNCWFCYRHRENKDLCSMGNIYEKEVYAAFLSLYNRVWENQDLILNPMLEQLLELQEKVAIAKPEITELHNQIANLARQNHSLAKLQAKRRIDPALFLERCSRINRQMEELRRKLRGCQGPDALGSAVANTRVLLEALDGVGPMLEIEPDMFQRLVQKITVYPQKYRFHLVNGLVLEERRE